MIIPDNSELLTLMKTARLGFAVVPVLMQHSTMGTGQLFMDGKGIKFKPDGCGVPLCLTWEEFDKGPRK